MEIMAEDIDQKALRLAKNDAALWYHHRALLAGEEVVSNRGQAHWNSYVRTKALTQFPAVEASVIQAWRKYARTVMGIPPEMQSDIHEVNCALILDSLRRKPDQAAELLKKRANTMHAAALKGDANFFRQVGRLLGERKNSEYLKRFEYAHAMLSRWFTDYLWLMPAKLASERLAEDLNVADNIKTFLACKSRYGLKSHKPSLIDSLKMEPDKNSLRITLTKQGKRLLDMPTE